MIGLFLRLSVVLLLGYFAAALSQISVQPQVLLLPARVNAIYMSGLTDDCGSTWQCTLSCAQFGDVTTVSGVQVRPVQSASETSKGWIVVCSFAKRWDARDAVCILNVAGIRTTDHAPVSANATVYVRTRIAFQLSAVDVDGLPSTDNGTFTFPQGYGGRLIARGTAPQVAQQRCVSSSTAPATFQLRTSDGRFVTALPTQCTAVDDSTVEYSTFTLQNISTPLGSLVTQTFSASLSGGETALLGDVMVLGMMNPDRSAWWTAATTPHYCLAFDARTSAGERTRPPRVAVALPYCTTTFFNSDGQLCCNRSKTVNDDESIIVNGVRFLQKSQDREPSNALWLAVALVLGSICAIAAFVAIALAVKAIRAPSSNLAFTSNPDLKGERYRVSNESSIDRADEEDIDDGASLSTTNKDNDVTMMEAKVKAVDAVVPSATHDASAPAEFDYLS